MVFGTPSESYDPEAGAQLLHQLGEANVSTARESLLQRGVLAKLVRGWRVEALVRAGESRAQWAERVMQGKALMTFGVRDVPVRLVRRG